MLSVAWSNEVGLRMGIEENDVLSEFGIMEYSPGKNEGRLIVKKVKVGR